MEGAPKSRTHRTASLAVVVAAALMAIALPSVVRTPTLVLWNASASVPEGLYLVWPNHKLRVGDLAVTHLPKDAQTLAAERRYLPMGVPLIKPVAALSGANVCRHDAAMYINGARVATAMGADHWRRPLPDWQGCRRLSPSELFLLNPAVPDSFDGRYFGPTPQSLVIGSAFPVLTLAQSKDR